VAAEAAERASAPGVSHLFFVDSVFNVPHAHAMGVCDALVATGTPMRWVCYLSPFGFDDALARRMARAGCVGVEVGADAGSDAGLARLRKPFSLADIRRSHELCTEHGIRDCHTFVLGVGEETVDDVRRTLEFVDELAPDVAVFVVFVEDREERSIARARHREAILRLLAAEAPRRPGWVVPELSIRFGAKLARVAQRMRFRGPSWLALAGRQRLAG
jgi:biotin synthase-like enzyme